MNETLPLVLTGAAGLLLGATFFGGLWWTIRRGLVSQRPALWFLGSVLLRMSIALAGFYFISGGQWDRLLPCLLGFVVARFIVTRAAIGRKPNPFSTGGQPCDLVPTKSSSGNTGFSNSTPRLCLPGD